MQFYRIPNSYSAQIEGAGLNLRFGGTCLGIAPPQKFWHRGVRELPKWYRLLLPLSLSFFAHAGCGQTHFVELRLGAFCIWWQNQGDRPISKSKEMIERSEQAGVHASWRGLGDWRLLF